jgi:hypothetical protein
LSQIPTIRRFYIIHEKYGDLPDGTGMMILVIDDARLCFYSGLLFTCLTLVAAFAVRQPSSKSG